MANMNENCFDSDYQPPPTLSTDFIIETLEIFILNGTTEERTALRCFKSKKYSLRKILKFHLGLLYYIYDLMKNDIDRKT